MAAGITVEIINKKGLHARAAAKFVKIVVASSARVTVVKKDGTGDEANTVQGSSILGLMMLGADPGSYIVINATGDGAEQVLQELKELVESRFGEED